MGEQENTIARGGRNEKKKWRRRRASRSAREKRLYASCSNERNGPNRETTPRYDRINTFERRRTRERTPTGERERESYDKAGRKLPVKHNKREEEVKRNGEPGEGKKENRRTIIRRRTS